MILCQREREKEKEKKKREKDREKQKETERVIHIHTYTHSLKGESTWKKEKRSGTEKKGKEMTAGIQKVEYSINWNMRAISWSMSSSFSY